VILVTHDENVAAHAKRILRFRDGRLVSDELVSEPIHAADTVAQMQPLPEAA
jgi:putative ABC transport system ATP-binding protein